MNYKQSVYTIQLRYIKDDFEYIVDSFSGEREESIKKTKLNTCKSLFDDIQDIKLNMSLSYLNKLKKKLKFIKSDLNEKRINVSILINLHNEKVVINHDKEDDRSYGFLRLMFKDIENNIHIDDIPIVTCDPDDLEENIIYHVSQYVDNHILTNEKRSVNFKCIPHILSPKVSGFFIHEIIGHTLESDTYNYYKNKYENINISKKLTVIDSIKGFEKLIGFQSYDDEGIEIKPLTIIDKGKIQNIFAIKSKESFNNKLYGFARRESYKSDVLPRMRATYIQPFDNMKQQEILKQYENAVFINEAVSGKVNSETGDYEINGTGFVVRNGEKQNFIGNLKVLGNILNDISAIDFIGNDFQMFCGYCSKYGQCVRVGIGGPTISISSLNSRGNLYGRR